MQTAVTQSLLDLSHQLGGDRLRLVEAVGERLAQVPVREEPALALVQVEAEEPEVRVLDEVGVRVVLDLVVGRPVEGVLVVDLTGDEPTVVRPGRGDPAKLGL